MSSKAVSILGFILGAALLGSCTKKSIVGAGPEKSLQNYISQTFAIDRVSERKELEKFLAGDALARFRAMSNAFFQDQFLNRKREFVRLKFENVNKQSADRVAIAYQLVFLDQSKRFHARVTQRKLCTLIKEESMWKILEIRNVKELVEYEDGVEF